MPLHYLLEAHAIIGNLPHLKQREYPGSLHRGCRAPGTCSTMQHGLIYTTSDTESASMPPIFEELRTAFFAVTPKASKALFEGYNIRTLEVDRDTADRF